jgi:hypothetical protein
VGVLVDALCRPIFERRNAEGRHTYALFLWHIARSNWWAGPAYEMSIAATQEILKHIDRALPQVPRAYRLERMQAVGDIVAGALQRLDASGADEPTKAQMFEHALGMAKAVVAMPFDAARTKDDAGAPQAAATPGD